MRYIDLGSLEIPHAWLSEAEKALNELKKIVQKKAIIGQIRATNGDISILRRVVSQFDESDTSDEFANLKKIFETVAEIDLAELSRIIDAIEKLDKQLKISAEIEKHADTTWRALKPFLCTLIEGIMPSDDHPDGKCWYCESRYRVRMLEVDHFRPKASVRGDNDYRSEIGYWWLTFDYRNFRLSCQTCNRLEKGDDDITRGKGTWFPLANENKRAYNDINIGSEIPLLLDPTRAEDIHLLAFLADGSVEPSNSDEKSLDHQRAKRSIDIYHLNAPRDKRLAICREIQNLILEADIAYRISITTSIDPEIRREQDDLFVRKIIRLTEYLQIQSAYSRAAEAEAGRQAQKFEWVEDVIEQAEEI